MAGDAAASSTRRSNVRSSRETISSGETIVSAAARSAREHRSAMTTLRKPEGGRRRKRRVGQSLSLWFVAQRWFVATSDLDLRPLGPHGSRRGHTWAGFGDGRPEAGTRGPLRPRRRVRSVLRADKPRVRRTRSAPSGARLVGMDASGKLFLLGFGRDRGGAARAYLRHACVGALAGGAIGGQRDASAIEARARCWVRLSEVVWFYRKNICGFSSWKKLCLYWSPL